MLSFFNIITLYIPYIRNILRIIALDLSKGIMEDVMNWLKKNKDDLSLRAISLKIGTKENILKDALKNNQLPKKWERSLNEWWREHLKID